MNRKIFLAGGTGVLGRRLVPQLIGAGHQVTLNVRNDDAEATARRAGAEPIRVDLFDATAVTDAARGSDAIINVATAIPTGASAAVRRGWAMNDRLRTEAAANLAGAANAIGAHYIGESITFPYSDAADQWIDESVERSYSSATESVAAAESSAEGASGVILRFAMFSADDSAHTRQLLSLARLGILALPGAPNAFVSWIHIDDAASAVVAALDAPAGVYNVAEANPARRADHMQALAAALGRKRLRGLPPLVVSIGGPPVEAVARSQRISSRAFSEATDWEPRHDIINTWAGG